MTLGDPLNEATTFLRNTIAQSPAFGDKWTVVNIETFGANAPGLMVLDLDDGTTISLDVERYVRDKHDDATLQAKLAARS